MADDFPVVGLIERRWRYWGAAAGPFGRPLGPEEPDPASGGRRQVFERGEIIWSAAQDTVVSGFRLRTEACFEWSRPGHAFDHFCVDVAFQAPGGDRAFQGPGRNLRFGFEGVWSTQQYWTTLQGFGDYDFVVAAFDDEDDDQPPRGWASPVRLRLGPSAEAPSTAKFAVRGPIAERWHELGASAGPLGDPSADEVFNPATGVVAQRFKYGTVTTAPKFGPGMVVAAYQRGRDIEVVWGGGEPHVGVFRYEAFLVERWFNGARVGVDRVESRFPDTDWARSQSCCGKFLLEDARQDGLYWFFVQPVIDNFPIVFGQTPQAAVLYARGAADADLDSVLQVLPQQVVGDRTVLEKLSHATAFASQPLRATAVARHYARTRPIRLVGSFFRGGPASENSTMQVIAHLHMVAREPGFQVPGELPSHLLVHTWLGARFMGHGNVGTEFNEELAPGVLLRRPGDYDIALKGLLPIVLRYGHLLTEAEIDHVLDDLVPPQLVGPHDPAIEFFRLPPVIPVETGIGVPETENHLLMIGSTRYLMNQIRFAQTGQGLFNNRLNGLADWLVGRMQEFVRHDFLEFNSRPYARLSVHALLNLHEFSDDDRVRTAARIVLDYLAMKFAISSNRLRRIGPFRRQKGRTNHHLGDGNNLVDGAGDQMTGYFLMWVGPFDVNGLPERWSHDGLLLVGMICGPAPYRPPPAAYLVALGSGNPAMHRFHHGNRPRLTGSLEQADPGIEIYFRSQSFMLTAGGMFLNSGYGFDELTSYKQVAVAQATTLIPTRASVPFVDLVRFDPWPPTVPVPNNPDTPVDESIPANDKFAVNTGVHLGFACGADLVVPERWLRPGTVVVEGRWTFLNLHDDAGNPLGLYLATHRSPRPRGDADDAADELDVLAVKNLGFIYACEATVMTFQEFVERTLERNQLQRDLGWGETATFHTPDEPRRELRFTLSPLQFSELPGSHKYLPRIVEVGASPPQPATFTSLPLVQGPWLDAPGPHDGRVEIRQPAVDGAPACDTPLVLDLRDRTDPVRQDNTAACPGAVLDRLRALLALSQRLVVAGRHGEAVELLTDRMTVARDLFAAAPDRFGPELVAAAMDLLFPHAPQVERATAMSVAQQALVVTEQLAGLRPPGFVGPIDYRNLGPVTPNQWWQWPGLSGAWWNLAAVQKADGRPDLAAEALIARIEVHRRLAAHDPAIHRGPLVAAYRDLLGDPSFRVGLTDDTALELAAAAVTAGEVLAGLRDAGSDGDVDYDDLDRHVPTAAWPTPGLADAWINLALVRMAAGRPGAAAAALVVRVKVLRRLAEHDPATHATALASGCRDLVGDPPYRLAAEGQAARDVGELFVATCEVLAGLRESETEDDVDYDDLDAFIPNDRWAFPWLAESWWNLAFVHREAGRLDPAEQAVRNCVAIHRRLATHSPEFEDDLAAVLAAARTFGIDH